MRKFARLFIALIVAVSIGSAPAFAAGTASSRDSSALNDYLHGQKLPLVNAQITKDKRGRREVVLYGYTATDLGKQHATERVGEFLHDSKTRVVNRIQVKPELADLGTTPTSVSAMNGARSSSSGISASANTSVNSSAGSFSGSSNGSFAANAAPAGQQTSSDPQFGTSQQYQQGSQQSGTQQGSSQSQSGFGTGSTMSTLALAVLSAAIMGGASGTPFMGNQMSAYGYPQYPQYGPSPYQAGPYGAAGYGPYGGGSPYGPGYGGPPYASNPYAGSPYGPPAYGPYSGFDPYGYPSQ